MMGGTKTARNDLIAVRDAVLAGADWLEAMMAVDGMQPGSKRYVQMHIALKRGMGISTYSLTDFFLKRQPEDIAAIFNRVIAALPSCTPRLPAWPVFKLPTRGVAP